MMKEPGTSPTLMEAMRHNPWLGTEIEQDLIVHGVCVLRREEDGTVRRVEMAREAETV